MAQCLSRFHVTHFIKSYKLNREFQENGWTKCRIMMHGWKPGDENDSLHSQDTSLLDDIAVTHVVNSLLSFDFLSTESGYGRYASFHALQEEKYGE
jgi:hypothetical protein